VAIAVSIVSVPGVMHRGRGLLVLAGFGSGCGLDLGLLEGLGLGLAEEQAGEEAADVGEAGLDSGMNDSAFGT